MRQEILDGPALDVLDGLAREAALEIGSVACLISVLDGGRPFLRSEVGLPLSMVAGQETPLLDSLCLLVAGRSGPLIVEDAQRDSEVRVSRTLRRLGIRSCLGYPLSGDGRLLGSFCVIGDGQRCWNADQVELAQRLSAMAAAELATRMRDARRDELEVGLEPLRARVNGSFLRQVALEESVADALEALCRDLAWDVAGAWVVDEQGTELHCVGQWHRASHDLEAFAEICRALRFAPGEDMVGTVWTKQELIWSPELPLTADFPRASIAAGAGLSCAAWIPLVAGFQPLGALELLAAEVRPLHARTMPQMPGLARQIAELIALRREEEEGLPASWVAPAPVPRPRGPFTGLPQPGEF